MLSGMAVVPAAAAAYGVLRWTTQHVASADQADAAASSPASSLVIGARPEVPEGSAKPGWDILEENSKPGTGDWQITQVRSAWDKVRGYLSHTSAQRGDKVALFVSTSAPAFVATAYRMGHYGGLGGRQVWTSGPQTGKQQAPVRVDRSTNLRDAPWEPSVWIPLDESWVPGAYLFKLTSSDGGESQVPFVVRDDERPSAVHIQHDVTTWQAYNRWGGASLYEGDGGRAKVVSFDRPYDLSGSGNFLGGVREITALTEQLGIDTTHSTSLDTHSRPELAARHKVWISPAHDEYWSLEMRNGVEAARDVGVNLIFLGANCMYRRIRLEPSFWGKHRLVVNYRTAKDDPLKGVDPQRVTASWREAPSPRPESSIVGNFYESNPVRADMVIVNSGAWMFEGTGVRDGDRWQNLVGNEYDRVTPEVPTPPNIEVLAHSPLTVKGKKSFADMTYYTADSGAGVFSSGSIWFERHLLPGGTGTDAQIIAMMTNILRVFASGPAGQVHPSRNNLSALGIHRGYLPRIS